MVVQGFAQGLDVVCAALVANGKQRLAIEDPALRDAVMTARQAGVEVIPVPVDGDGIDVAALAQTRADAVLVTPAHQFPTGVVLTPDRRRALLQWARTTDALVIEDDYDAEFRHDGPPVGALQGLAPDHVVYVGSASKTLAPARRLGWLALPRRLAATAADAKWWRDSGSPLLDQLALADFITSGTFDRSRRRALRSVPRTPQPPRQRDPPPVAARTRDVAIEASDITLVAGDLGAAADAVRLSRRTLRTIKANLFWAFAYNVAALPLAATGLLSPLLAGVAMAGSSVFVVSNSLRLRRFRSHHRPGMPVAAARLTALAGPAGRDRSG